MISIENVASLVKELMYYREDKTLEMVIVCGMCCERSLWKEILKPLTL